MSTAKSGRMVASALQQARRQAHNFLGHHRAGRSDDAVEALELTISAVVYARTVAAADRDLLAKVADFERDTLLAVLRRYCREESRRRHDNRVESS